MKKSFLTLLFLAMARVLALEPCRIEVVEKSSGWPVPLVELRTTHHVRFVSDNNGLIAVDAPELMNRQVWFDVLSPGYEIAKDGFGYRGVRFDLVLGKTYKVEMTRTIIAKRLGRITGAGIFGESQKLGRELDWAESGVWGQDSVQNAAHRGKMFWVWGDTLIPSYPLGIFNSTGATTEPSPLPSFEPPLKLRLNYFIDEKKGPRAVAMMPSDGLTWLSALTSLPDKNGKPHLVASFMKVKPPLEAVKWGLCVWNEDAEKFEFLKWIWEKSETNPKPPHLPDGHPALWNDGGKSWLLFGNPLPKFKCPATFEAWQDLSAWEELKPQETLAAAGSDAKVKPHSGSIAWNEFRQHWVTVFMEHFGRPSVFGEVWYAEAKSPIGPWGPAVKILSHDNYTFYNPRLHPEFTPAKSHTLLFEGTYTKDFADKPIPTPRYEYNQVMYRLDLDDPKLKPAHKAD